MRGDCGEVEVALVDAHLLDARAQLPDERPHLLRALAVPGMIGRDEDRVRTAPPGLRRAHARADPERPRLVARGRDPRRGSRACHRRPRQPAQFRTVELLAGGEEGVEIEVRDHGFAGACLTVRTAETPGANASPPAYSARTAVRVRGTCSVARARPVASSSTTAAAWKVPERWISIRTGLRREGGRPADHDVQHARIVRVATRLRDSQPGCALHGADQRELQSRGVARAYAQPHAAAAERARVEAERCPAHAGRRAPDLLTGDLDREPVAHCRLRPHPERERRRIARHEKGPAAQQEVARLGREGGPRLARKPAVFAAPMSNTNPRAGVSVRPGPATSMPSPRDITGSSTSETGRPRIGVAGKA